MSLIYNEQRQRYIEAIQSADQGKNSLFIAFVAHSLNVTQQEMLKLLRAETHA